jgi:hypothetical protein
LGSIPAIYKEDAKPKAPLNRSGEGSKLGGDGKPAVQTPTAEQILDVHGAPTEMQEG